MERKAFLQLVLTGVATGSITSIIEACGNTAVTGPTVNFTLDLTTSANGVLYTPGGYVISNNVIVINNNGTYIALSDLCTHQGCSVSFDKSSQLLLCPCHNATFGIDGTVKSGPAPSPLKSYTVTRKGNILTVVG